MTLACHDDFDYGEHSPCSDFEDFSKTSSWLPYSDKTRLSFGKSGSTTMAINYMH